MTLWTDTRSSPAASGPSRSKPSDVGIVTLSSFLQFWGVVFLVTTFFVWFFKPEVENGVNDKGIGIVETYKQVKKRIGDGKTPVRPKRLSFLPMIPNLRFSSC